MAHRPLLRVFVVGCSRGGTTVTQRLLAERLNLLTLPETRFFVSLIGNTDMRMFPQTSRSQGQAQALRMGLRNALRLSSGMEWRNADMIPAPRRRKWSPIARIARDFQNGMDQLARENKATGWLEKTPMHVHYAAEIDRNMDDAWFVHVIRDAQDNIASLWDAAQKYDDPWPIVYDRLERAVDNWNASIADSARMVGRRRHLFVRYSSLTANPKMVLDQIAQAMGQADVQPKVVQTAQGQLANPHEHGWKKASVSGEIAPAASKWETALTEQERSLAETLIAPIPQSLQDAMDYFASETSAVAPNMAAKGA